MKNLKDYILEINSKYPNVYLMVGIPGSGKSTWCKKNIPDFPVVSRDIIRAELGYTKNADEKAVLSKADEQKVTKVEMKRIADLAGQAWDKKIDGFVIDDTNTGKYRTNLINELHSLSLYVIGVNMNTPFEECVKNRKGQIPKDVMKTLWDNKVELKPDDVDEIIIGKYEK